MVFLRIDLASFGLADSPYDAKKWILSTALLVEKFSHVYYIYYSLVTKLLPLF